MNAAMNIVYLQGTVVAVPVVRQLPSGSSALQFDLRSAVDGHVATVPVTWLDPPVDAAPTAGDDVVVLGAVQRRFFRVAASTQSRTEVVVRSLVRASNRRAVAKLRVQAAAAFESG